MVMGGGGRGLGPRSGMANSAEGKPKNPWLGVRRLLPWLYPYRAIILLGLVCMGVSTFLGVQPLRIVGSAIDSILGRGEYERAWRVVLLILGIHAAQALFSFLRMYYLHVAGQKLIHELRVQVYQRLQKQSLTFFDNRQTGDLMSRTTGDVEQVQFVIEHGFDVLLIGIFNMALAFYYIHKISPQMAVLALLPIPVLIISIYFFSKTIRNIYRAVRDRMGDLNAKLQDNLAGIRVIKAFSREEIEQQHVTNESASVLQMSTRAIRMWSSFGPSMGFVSSLGSVLVLIVGLRIIGSSTLTAGDLFICWGMVGNLYNPVHMLFQFFDNIQRSLAAGERIFEVLDAEPDVEDPVTPRAFADVRGEVAFEGVTFKYATGETVLHQVHVRAQPGERVALVGRSGAGKTSFINLIPRFYDVLEGRVTIDGIDVRELRQVDLRRHIALVLQETFLFNGSVRDNLRFGKQHATDAELIEAATVANAHEFIVKLPDGYDTEIGERGVKLSGGQRQRLSIARAVLANPRILILDEATSSVDSESEFLIHQALERLMEGRTTFVIAHRLSTIKHANVILVLDDGEIIERGSHEELVRADGHYAQMYRQQFWLDELFAEEREETTGSRMLPPTVRE